MNNRSQNWLTSIKKYALILIALLSFLSCKKQLTDVSGQPQIPKHLSKDEEHEYEFA